MSVLFLIIFFIVALCIVGLVLLQEGKGGGLTGMSTGMDGVMGAKNPLRRMTAYFFIFFVIMCLVINWYFHQREDKILPAGAVLPAAAQVIPDASVLSVPEGALRPEDAGEAPAAPESVRPADAAPGEQSAPMPENMGNATEETLGDAVEQATAASPEALSTVNRAVEEAASETAAILRPEPQANEPAAHAAPVQPPEGDKTADQETVPVAPPPAE